MASFQSLSAVINNQVLQTQARINDNASARSSVAVQNATAKVNNQEIEQEKDVLRWGFSIWGVQKVTSEYKPNEIR